MSDTIANIFKTPAVKGIEKAYQRGGATATHTPGYAGTARAEREGVADTGGVGSKDFKENYEDQRPQTNESAVGKVWNNMTTGTDRGK